MTSTIRATARTVSAILDPIGWLLYDDSCGICRRGISFWEAPLRRRGFAVAPLQEPWVRSRLEALDVPPVDDFHLLLASGSLITGSDAYRFAMRSIWWAYPAYALSLLPGVRSLFDATYRWLARHRHGVSRACGLTDARTVADRARSDFERSPPPDSTPSRPEDARLLMMEEH